jgi:hypothetical protein
VRATVELEPTNLVWDSLSSPSKSCGSYTYAYDQTGNRVRMVQGSTKTVYCYGAFNRLSGYYTSTSCSSPAVLYTYDSNGNTVTKTGGWTYSYDYENRLTKAAQSGTTKQQNYYDGDGNRVKQVAGSSTFTYSYQGLNILYEKSVTGRTTYGHETPLCRRAAGGEDGRDWGLLWPDSSLPSSSRESFLHRYASSPVELLQFEHVPVPGNDEICISLLGSA